MDAYDKLARDYPLLKGIIPSIREAGNTLLSCFKKGGKLLLCGNGGSCADCEHIAGELVKKFAKDRPLSLEQEEKLGPELSKELHGGLPAISLPSMIGFHTAFNNDEKPDFAFAQQVVTFGKPEDVLWGISTSGNSKNVVHASRAANALGLKTIALTGQDGGELATLAKIVIQAPAKEVAKIQELHLPIYHALCKDVEDKFFS